ncbi:MAG: hypothetical protein IK099_09850 [Clostridia bacterium]|nr:hypothetical protein [Clostridia bacterium]
MRKILCIFLSIFLLFCSAAALSEATVRDILGITEDSAYQNAFLGFGFHLEDWTVLSQERSEEVEKFAKQLLSSDAQESIEASGSFAVFSAIAPNSTDNINAVLIPLDDQAARVFELLGIKYLYENQLDQLQSTLEDAQMQDISIVVSSIAIDGRELTCLRTACNYMGQMNIHSLQISFIKDTYLINITATASAREAAEDAMGRIFWMQNENQ